MQFATALDSLDPAAVPALLERFGSPLVVVSEEALRHRQAALARALPGMVLFFPYKACPLRWVRSWLRGHGVGAEVANSRELETALALGVAPKQILIDQPLRDDGGWRLAAQHGVGVVADGARDVERLAGIVRLSSPLPLLLRICPTMSEHARTRFGLPLGDPELYEAARLAGACTGLRLRGLKIHLGTNLEHAAGWDRAVREICAFWSDLERTAGCALEVLDLGGGIATPAARPVHRLTGDWHPDAPEEVSRLVSAALAEAGLRERVAVWMEPGRLLVEDSALLLTTVVHTATCPFGPVATCDAGLHVLPTATWLAHEVCAYRGGRWSPSPTADYVLYGALCMETDVIRASVPLPLDLKPGDHLAVGSTGAYDLAQASSFIHGRCAVVLLPGAGEPSLLRRREDGPDRLEVLR